MGPYFEINLDSIDSSFEIRKKITVHQDNDKILSIISTLKIRIDRKIFNTTEDFNKYLVDNLGLITDDKITQTLRKKYGIKITGNIKERNKIDKINGIKNKINDNYDVKKLFNNQEFKIKYKGFVDFQ